MPIHPVKSSVLLLTLIAITFGCEKPTSKKTFAEGDNRKAASQPVATPTLPVEYEVSAPETSGARTEDLGLKDFAGDTLVGAAINESILADHSYDHIIAKEYNVISLSYGLVLRPSETEFNFKAGEKVADFAVANNLTIQGGAGPWYANNPAWVYENKFNPRKLADLLKTQIQTVISHYNRKYPGQFDSWSIVNEPLSYVTNRLRIPYFGLEIEQLGPFSSVGNVWANINPLDPEAYIRQAFQWANEVKAPGQKLYMNEIWSEMRPAKFEALVNLLKSLKKKGVPIDGIGLQMHNALPKPLHVTPERFAELLKRIGALGLDVHVTELDIALPDALTPALVEKQAQLYRGYARTCKESPVCKSMITWGVSDADSWIPSFFPGMGSALLFDKNFQRKPAYEAFKQGLMEAK